jgi:hypothetical protein
MPENPHGDLMAAAAKVHLSPIGMKRRGRSRIWLKDNGWWLAVVEFQPGAWSKGTYLNVAATWLWHAKDHLSFDECKRVGGFAEFNDPQSFASATDNYALRAAIEVSSLCKQFPTLDAAARHLRAKADGNPWHHYHAMMASLAAGELDRARAQHEALARVEHDVPWCLELKAKAAAMIVAAENPLFGQDLVSTEVLATRASLKLAAIDRASIWHPHE